MELKEQFKPFDFDPDQFTKRRWTYDELLVELPETTTPIELWEGEFVMSPSPSFFHQKLIDRFHDRLKAWVVPRTLGETCMAPMDMILTQRQVAQPDVLFVAKDRLGIIQDRVRGPADLVLEVISPGSRQKDRIEKRDLYEQHGIQEYWIIDPDAQTVETLFLEAGEYRLVGRWHPGDTARSRLLDGFTVSVGELFGTAAGT
jgi:Uma2 family endonuclease